MFSCETLKRCSCPFSVVLLFTYTTTKVTDAAQHQNSYGRKGDIFPNHIWYYWQQPFSTHSSGFDRWFYEFHIKKRVHLPQYLKITQISHQDPFDHGVCLFSAFWRDLPSWLNFNFFRQSDQKFVYFRRFDEISDFRFPHQLNFKFFRHIKGLFIFRVLTSLFYVI